ncbi:MAG: groEL [Gammaproteobacteria bacterium]|nr:groEL [Gammaproteobacteria bacterium]
MAAKIVSQNEPGARDRVFAGVQPLADAVRVTLGPKGRHVVLENPSGTPIITKDGVAIARAIDLTDSFMNMGAQVVKQVAGGTADDAGDGTTTATVLAQAIIREGLRAMTAGFGPMELKRGIDRAVDAVVEWISSSAKPVKDARDVAHVGTIAANQDEQIGRMLSDALDRVGHNGVVTVEEGSGFEDELDVVEGMQFDRGYLSPQFITDTETQTATLENCVILLCDYRISNIRELLPLLEGVVQRGQPLLVIAEEVESEALATLVVNHRHGVLKVVAVRAPGLGEARHARLQDLAILTAGKLISRTAGGSLEMTAVEDLGEATRVVIGANSTTIVGGRGTRHAVDARIAELKRAAEAAATDFERTQLQERIAKLANGIAVVRVGGATEVEMKERKARIEDALAAARAAIEEGVIPGGGVTLLRAQRALRDIEDMTEAEEMGIRVLGHALEAPLRQIAENAELNGAVVIDTVRRGRGSFGLDAATGRYGDVLAAGILDPAKVTRIALQNAASVAGLLLTTDVFIVDAKPTPADLDQLVKRHAIGLPRAALGTRRGFERRSQLYNLVDSLPGDPFSLPAESRDDTGGTGRPDLAGQLDEFDAAFAADTLKVSEAFSAVFRPERFLNTAFTYEKAGRLVPKDLALVIGTRYQLRIDIGAYRRDSLDVDPTPVPEEALPETDDGHWLEIVVASEELDFKTEAPRHSLFLPKTGPSWICRCKSGTPHVCTPDKRQPFLYFRFETGRDPGAARVRLGLYHEGNLLQSQLIRVTIAEDEVNTTPAEARTDYRLIAGLGEVPPLPARQLSILTNDNENFSHRLIVNGDIEKPLSYSLTEDQVGNAMATVRQTLVDIHIQKIGSAGATGAKVSRYRDDNSKPRDEYLSDLKTLAMRGRELWSAVSGDRDAMHELALRLRRKSAIQVARTQNSRLVFPWAMLYDYSLETGPTNVHTFCKFAESWYDPHGSVTDIPEECPDAKTHAPNVVCPYGFWGLRHVIEQPPSMPKDRTLPIVINARPQALMVVALSRDLKSTEHLVRLAKAAAGQQVRMDSRDTRETIKGALAGNPALELVYFYCHGRHAKPPGGDFESTYLEVGDQEAVTATDFNTWNASWDGSHWKNISPLVMINGCHTTDMTPSTLATFVDSFTNAYAAGIIGTETTVHENIASEAAERLIKQLCNGAAPPKERSVGESIRKMRFELLRKGNVMGLTYTAYCSAQLTLIHT